MAPIHLIHISKCHLYAEHHFTHWHLFILSGDIKLHVPAGFILNSSPSQPYFRDDPEHPLL